MAVVSRVKGEVIANSAAGPRYERSLWMRLALVFRRSRSATLGILMMLLIMTMAVSAPWIAPHDPNKQHLAHAMRPPAWSPEGMSEYPLGTDHFGRDVLSRAVWGARATLLASFLATLVAGTIGVLLGLIAGYYGGRIESVIMRIVDIQLAFPMILLALTLVAMFGCGFRNLVFAMGITGWMTYARIVRGSVLVVKEREFVLAARCVGVGDSRLILRHILPNVSAPIIVVSTLEMARLILVESGLTYLGLGVPPTTPTWGHMLADGRTYMTVAYWMVAFPGLAIMVTVLGINLFGDGLRDALDPRLRID